MSVPVGQDVRMQPRCRGAPQYYITQPRFMDPSVAAAALDCSSTVRPLCTRAHFEPQLADVCSSSAIVVIITTTVRIVTEFLLKSIFADTCLLCARTNHQVY